MCCGSDDDYYTVSPYRPPNEKPHPSVSHAYSQRQPRAQNRGPSREEIEKRQRQAQATTAARNYGWPTSHRDAGSNSTNYQRHGNRDSIIEPDLAGGLAAMPGSDFRAVYDPQRSQQQPVHTPTPPRPYQRPPYYQQRFVAQQPTRTQPMRAAPQQDSGRAPQMVQRRPGIARRPVIQTAHPVFQAPQTARIVRRDSNGISECSDDEGDCEDLRNYTVSPLQQSPVYSSRMYH
ncbi:hypothetical protein GQX73_g5443 [Xylaria multiplex]|uniref:Uncharacterized protein n=1 Tax=Xylaria multiplex TaxID=323545 RepID=A0A7C8MS50_9PEZI|nr:hypothetical protein GQX73_g5443 [Xylaria multiplex]